MTANTKGRRRRLAAWTAFTGLVLLVPLVAMPFSDDVVWDAFDFAVLGALTFGTGATYELVASRVGVSTYRAGAGVALASGFVMVWVNGAVGLIGNEEDAANLLFSGVLAVGSIGALVVRFRPDGMARALLAMALAQVLVAAIILDSGWGSDAPGWRRDVFAVTGFFATLWLTSAWLFQSAARRQGREPRGTLA